MKIRAIVSVADAITAASAAYDELAERAEEIEDEWSYQIISKPGQTLVKTVQWIPKVNQTFGGTFAASKPPPGRAFPPCVKRSLPWVGHERPVVNGVIK